ncbi:MAG: hypothetical protein R3C16_10835 [Hyphomonadaceae bacterium]
MTLEQFFASDAGQQLQIDMAGLSDMEQANVMAALQKAADEGGLETVDTNDVYLNAQVAEEKREEAEMYQAEQAKAVEAGDWETAKEMSEKAEDAMLEVEEYGGDVDGAEIIQAEHDQIDLDYADYHQEIADDNAATAEAYAEEGDLETASIYADSAADEATVAADLGAGADQGGVYADQTVDTSSSFDSTATASTIDTSIDTTIDTTGTE